MSNINHLLINSDQSFFKLSYDRDSVSNIFTFAARSQKPGTFSYFNSRSSVHINRYQFNCPNNTWYLSGIPGFSSNFDETVEKLRLLNKGAHDMTRGLFIGSSMGGYAATLFGSKCNARRVIAFGTELVTNLPTGYSRENISNLEPDSPFLSLVEHIDHSSTFFDFVCGEYCLPDLYSAGYVSNFANVHVHLLARTRHMAVTRLKDEGILPDIVENGLKNRTLPIPKSLLCNSDLNYFINSFIYKNTCENYKEFVLAWSRFRINQPDTNYEVFDEVITVAYKHGYYAEGHRLISEYEIAYGQDLFSAQKRIQFLYRERRYSEVMAFSSAEAVGTTYYFKAAAAKRAGYNDDALKFFEIGVNIARNTSDKALEKSLFELNKNLKILDSNANSNFG